MSEKILIIDRIEDIMKDGEVAGRECFNSTGASVKVKKGKGDFLKNKWDSLIIGRAYSFEMGEFTPAGKDRAYPYVVDFKSVESQLVKKAQERVENKTMDTRDKSMAISYSKDLVVAGKIPITSLITKAQEIYEYITGGDDEALQVHKAIAPDTKPDTSEKVSADEAGQEAGGEPIDLVWLHNSLEELHWTTVVKDMKAKYEIGEGKTVREVLEFMNELQKADFVAQVKKSLSMGPPF